MCGTLKMDGKGAGLLVRTPCRYAKEMFIMKWHSAIVWPLSVHNYAAQLFAVPPHCVMLHTEAATIGGLAEECFVLGTDMCLSVCLSIALAAFTHLWICHWEANIFCL